MDENRLIGIVGCGTMGYALAHRLSLYGFTVVMGSRHPENRDKQQFDIVFTTDCIRRSSIIFIALRAEHYIDSLVSCYELERSLFTGKILIDISNRSTDEHLATDEISNAEQLQRLIPNALIVKAFNTISSFAMKSSTTGESRLVFVASDHSLAKDKIMTLAREMNFDTINAGSIRAAHQLEKYNQNLFSRWQMPTVVTLIIVAIWLIYTLCMNYINTTTSWNQLFLHMTNKTLCLSAITMLGLVYMPSNIACLFQLVYGTRYKQFPTWLDQWLLNRKQLGLFAFVIGLGHATITIILVSPGYYSSWFHPVKISVSNTHNRSEIFIVPSGLMTGKAELASLFGLLTQLCMFILAITSIPSIGNLLNWREWRFIQSKLGFVTLLFAIAHVLVMAIPYWIRVGLIRSLYDLDLLCLYLPISTLFLKFIFYLPCLSGPLYRIRHDLSRKKTIGPIRDA